MMAYSGTHCDEEGRGQDFQPLWGMEELLRDLQDEPQETASPRMPPLADRINAFFADFGATCRELLSTVKAVSPFHKNTNDLADNDLERRRLLLLRIAAENTQSTWQTAPPDNSVAEPKIQATVSYRQSGPASTADGAASATNSQSSHAEPSPVQISHTQPTPVQISHTTPEPPSACSGEIDLAPVAKARLLSHQIAACMLGADPKNSTALAAVSKQFPKFSKGARLFIEASAVFAGELMGGPGGFKLAKLQRLLEKRGLVERATQPGVGRVLLNTLGAIAKALEDNELKLMDVLSSRATSDPKRLRLIFEYVNSGRFHLDLERCEA